MTQEQDDGGLDKRGRNGGIEKWWGSRDTLMVEPTDQLMDWACCHGIEVWDLSHWEDAAVKEAVSGVDVRDKIRNSILDILILRCQVTMRGTQLDT